MSAKEKSLYDRLVDRWAEMDSKYNKLNRNRDIIVNYFRCDEVLETDQSGHLVGQDIYNASGMWYSQMMARGFQGSLVSKNIPWIEYMIDYYELQGVDDLDIWMQEIKNFMIDDYQRSNFYDVQPQFTLDGITTGSPVMFGEEDIATRRVMWMPVHYKNVRVFYDKFNEPEGVIVREKDWTAKQLMDTFIGKDDESGTRRRAMLPAPVNQAIDAGRLNDEFTVYRGVFKVTDPIWDGGWEKPKGDWTWLSVYFCELASSDINMKNKPLNMNPGYFSQPFVVWDYDKKPWEPAARTPAWYAIWDNLGLQDIDKAFMENMQLKNRPPRYALSEQKGRLDFSSEGVTYLDREDYGLPPKALDMIGDISLNEKMVQINENKIARWFMADLWQKFSELIRTNKQPVTAAQIWQMVAEKSTLLSPAIESHSKYLKVSDARHINIASRRGEYPFDPQSVFDASEVIAANTRRPIQGIKIAPIFVGALAQAQKRNQELEPLRAGVGVIMESGITQLSPEAKFVIRGYKTVDKMLQALGFPQDCVRPEEEVDKMVAAEQQAMQQQQQFDNSIEAAKASKPAADALGQVGQMTEDGTNV
jgi:hypothetical protein